MKIAGWVMYGLSVVGGITAANIWGEAPPIVAGGLLGLSLGIAHVSGRAVESDTY